MVEGDGADLPEALRANVVKVIIGGVPDRVIEIDQIDRGDVGDVDERPVIVEDVAVEDGEAVPELQCVGGGHDIAA